MRRLVVDKDGVTKLVIGEIVGGVLKLKDLRGMITYSRPCETRKTTESEEVEWIIKKNEGTE
jgi:hypothetical protein